jgi:hypothetical protein
MAAAGGWGKMERRPRGIDSRAHLGSGRRVEAALRAAADWRWVIASGGAPVLRQGREVAGVVRDEVGNGAGLLIAGVRRFGGEILCSPAHRRARGGRPESRLSGDRTARAAMGQHGQRCDVSGRGRGGGRGELGVLGWRWH